MKKKTVFRILGALICGAYTAMLLRTAYRVGILEENVESMKKEQPKKVPLIVSNNRKKVQQTVDSKFQKQPHIVATADIVNPAYTAADMTNRLVKVVFTMQKHVKELDTKIDALRESIDLVKRDQTGRKNESGLSELYAGLNPQSDNFYRKLMQKSQREEV